MNLQYPDGATPLDPDEMAGLRHTYVTTREELDELEQANIETGLLWLGRQRKIDLFDDAFHRVLHKRLFGEVWEWAGRYRSTEKNIGVDPFQIQTEVRSLLDNARYWAANETFPALEAAARLHHRLVQVHPFPNGNGRYARIATDAVLKSVYRTRPIDWSRSANLLRNNERRRAYIAALRAADAGDYNPLLKIVGHT